MQGAWSLDNALAGRAACTSTWPIWAGWPSGWGKAGRAGGACRAMCSWRGAPARPMGEWSFAWAGFVFAVPEQGLTLARGALDVELRDNRLQIHGVFGFESPLQPPPRALRQVGGESLARLTAQPGRLDMVGEMRFDQPTGVKDVTDVTNAAMPGWICGLIVWASGSGRIMGRWFPAATASAGRPGCWRCAAC